MVHRRVNTNSLLYKMHFMEDSGTSCPDQISFYYDDFMIPQNSSLLRPAANMVNERPAMMIL
ncbi:hypothetical protein EAF00_004674 [Botryotinia globosa]|nr:hypothetical protein EAF00_004674 [Botryotinia globosa]